MLKQDFMSKLILLFWKCTACARHLKEDNTPMQNYLLPTQDCESMPALSESTWRWGSGRWRTIRHSLRWTCWRNLGVALQALKHASVLWTDVGSWSNKGEQLQSVAASCTSPHLNSIQRAILGFLDASYSEFDLYGENLVGLSKSKLCHRSVW